MKISFVLSFATMDRNEHFENEDEEAEYIKATSSNKHSGSLRQTQAFAGSLLLT